MADYQRFWEAWAGGWEDQGALSPTESVGEERIQQFYTDIVGPAFGWDKDEDMGFGEAYSPWLGTGLGLETGWTTTEMERAEREFRMAIGD